MEVGGEAGKPLETSPHLQAVRAEGIYAMGSAASSMADGEQGVIVLMDSAKVTERARAHRYYWSI